jgi:hypothetical protein
MNSYNHTVICHREPNVNGRAVLAYAAAKVRKMPGDRVSVVAATSLEAKAARRELPNIPVFESGVALARMRDGFGDIVVSCGLAGGVRHELHTGTVVIPREVLRPDGTKLVCDRELSDALEHAARELEYVVATDPIVTTAHVVTGEERARWANLGCAGVDMETGLLQAPRIAAVRVLLDTPLRELSEDWLNPVAAALKPWNWPQLVWLAREGPRCARIAARVAARALAGASCRR